MKYISRKLIKAVKLIFGKKDTLDSCIEKAMPSDPKYHIKGSHVICEDGKPVIRSTLWGCIRRIQQMESGMTRIAEHSDLTIIAYEPYTERNSKGMITRIKHDMKMYPLKGELEDDA